ncbi:MAG: GNAT family N-acetyltransferase [Candidatus Zixiibacteriota bacterium]|nr:MAG: GNAT family N-acetyltransferase [candidate division Zixibacteria bacterium]
MNYTRDKEALLRHFNKDPILFGYHIGDLDDFYFRDCEWAVSGNVEIEDAILIYFGLETPTVLAFGLDDRFNSFLEALLPELPNSFYCHYQKSSLGIFRKVFADKPLGSHLKMKLVSDGYDSRLDKNHEIQRLDMTHKKELVKLYERSYPQNYFNDRMLETGKYFGYITDGEVVCVSGVHVHSDEYKISVLGNITTHPDYRGRGLATAVTARLVKELHANGNTVALNVKKDNFAAIKCYQKLGFEIYCEYEESFFSRQENKTAEGG